MQVRRVPVPVLIARSGVAGNFRRKLVQADCSDYCQ